MDAVEFRPIAADLQARWFAFRIPEMALAQYVRDLHDLDAREVSAAVTAIAAEGGDRPPTAGAIRRRVVEMQLDVPSWDEVRTALVRWRAGRDERELVVEAWVCPHGVCTGNGWVDRLASDKVMRAFHCDCWGERLEARRGLRELPPIVAEFVTTAHVASAELDRMIEQGDTTLEAQVRTRWREFAARVVDSRVLASLPDVTDLPRIEAARAEDRERHGDPRRLTADGIAGMLERGAA